MQIFRGRDARTHLDRLLDGAEVPGEALSVLLAAARADGSAAETAGLDAAIAAFTAGAAPSCRTITLRKTRRLGALTANLVGMKLLAATAAGAAVGGIALAAATGHLSKPFTHTPAEPHTSTHRAPATNHPGEVGGASSEGPGRMGGSSAQASTAGARTPSVPSRRSASRSTPSGKPTDIPSATPNGKSAHPSAPPSPTAHPSGPVTPPNGGPSSHAVSGPVEPSSSPSAH